MACSAPLDCTSICPTNKTHKDGLNLAKFIREDNTTPYSAVATGAGTPDHIQEEHLALVTDNCTMNQAVTTTKILVMSMPMRGHSFGTGRWTPL